MPKKERTQITWKLDRLSKKQQDKVNNWADQQQNMQTSITNIMLHMIDRYGEVDFMDFDVQKVLFAESFSINTTNLTNTTENKLDNTKENIKNVDKKIETSHPTNDEDEGEDELYNNDLMNNL